MAVEVLRDDDEHRYIAQVDGAVAGLLAYRERPGLIALVHTEVDDGFEGQGVGSALAVFALDDARSRGLAVLPFCPFVAGWIARHRDYVDLVPQQFRATFDLV
jgi:predicted GNAT family acetyltransferase